MVPMQVCALKHDIGNDAENSQRYAFLNNLQLNEVEWTAILDKADSVGRNLTAILKESNAPREYNDAKKRPVVTDTIFL